MTFDNWMALLTAFGTISAVAVAVYLQVRARAQAAQDHRDRRIEQAVVDYLTVAATAYDLLGRGDWNLAREAVEAVRVAQVRAQLWVPQPLQETLYEIGKSLTKALESKKDSSFQVPDYTHLSEVSSGMTDLGIIAKHLLKHDTSNLDYDPIRSKIAKIRAGADMATIETTQPQPEDPST